MDAFHRLQFQLMQDEIHDRCQRCLQSIRSLFPRRNHRIGISLAEVGICQESEGRVWVEVGNEGLRLRVTHLHPANPAVAESLRKKCNERREAYNNRVDKSNPILSGKLIYPPEEDKISLSSLEDYWFNHWQGPYITADNNQNSASVPKLRRSLRVSRRTNRCSVCHKKRVTTELEDDCEVNCFERDEGVLAHMPSIKFDTRVLKEESEEKSDDETSDDALSKCSTTEDQLARVHRVLENELRTSFSLFADEVVSQDVVDATVCMDASDKVKSLTGSTRYLAPPVSPRQSRSCPCSPKLSKRTRGQESVSNSPKSRSFIGSSKFSLSSSLLAIHRQASNSLMPEFLKFESPYTSKANSQQNSLRSEPQKIRHSLSEAGVLTNREDSGISKHDTLSVAVNCDSNESSTAVYKYPLFETHSLPTLKLSKMSLTYRSGVIIPEQNEALDSGDFSENEEHEGAAAFPNTSKEEERPYIEHQIDSKSHVSARGHLPDVVPSLEINNGTCSYSCELESQNGVINLGFDGMEESSDFTENETALRDDAEVVSGERQISVNRDMEEEYTLDQQRLQLSETLRIEASSGPPVHDSGSTSSPFSSRQETQPSAKNNEQTFSVPNVGENSLEPGQYNTFIEKDMMQEARDMVFWWRQKTLPLEEESEFCLHEAECKVKQKPLLIFLHGIGSSADVWNQQLWYFLSCGYEVVAPDLLGHGLSSAPKDKKYYNFCNMLDYVSLVFDLFVPQGRKCIVIGHNYGCALAVALARGRPLSVSLVVLASCGGPSPLMPYSKYENSLSSTATRLLSPFINCGCLSRELLYTPRGKYFIPVVSDEKGIPSTPRYVLDNISCGQYWPEGDLAFHRRITIPTLLLYGMKDSSVSFVEMCEMEKTIPRAFLELIPGAGQELMTDAAEEVCHAIHRFIRRWKVHI